MFLYLDRHDSQDEQEDRDDHTKSFQMEKSFPNTWGACDKRIAENPSVAQNIVNALYEASARQAENIDATMKIAEQLCQRPTNSFDPITLIAPSKVDPKAWLSSKSSKDYVFMNHLQ